jgi:O-antigen/teichoic acid export membrane protein
MSSLNAEPTMPAAPIPPSPEPLGSPGDAPRDLPPVSSLSPFPPLPPLRRVIARAARLGQTKTMQASLWTAGNYGTSLVLRLGGSLILTRILTPDAFGIMAILNVCLFAFEMFSDLGIGPSVVQNKRVDARFINTAWTIQVIRGVVLWGGAALLAYPLALAFDKPQVAQMLPILGMVNAISGLCSTSLFTLKRDLIMPRLVILDLATQVLGLGVTIYFAWLLRSAWGLVIGSLIGQGIRMIGTHFLDPRYRNRFGWDPAAARAIWHFGSWIFLSSVLTFLLLQLDGLLLGRLLSAWDLGLYAIAKNIGQVLTGIVAAMGSMIAFPYLSRVFREEPQGLVRRNRHIRLALLLPAAAGLSCLTVFGHWVIDVLYPEAWLDSGWMLQVFAAGAFGAVVNMTYGNAFLAKGLPRVLFVFQIPQLVLLVAGSLVGYYVLGPRLGNPLLGFLIGYSATEWLNYPIVANRARKHGIWNPGLDAFCFAVAIVSIGLALLVKDIHLPHIIQNLRHPPAGSP